MRIVIVDDRASQRDGRAFWLSRHPGVDVEALTFEQAAALGDRWNDIDVAVLDGHDSRAPQRREHAAATAGIAPLAPHDNYIGVRIASSIRQKAGPDRPVIIMISAHARDSELRARRIAQAGVNYVFEHYEVDTDADTFVRAVLHPERFSRAVRSVDWAARGFEGEPDVAGAIDTLEASPAADMLLNDQLHHQHPEHEWAVRRLRLALHQALNVRNLDGGGPRTPRASRKSRLSEQLRQALGRDLPTDPQ